MTSILLPVDTPGYLENLMHAGQDALKQFDDINKLSANSSIREEVRQDKKNAKSISP